MGEAKGNGLSEFKPLFIQTLIEQMRRILSPKRYGVGTIEMNLCEMDV